MYLYQILENVVPPLACVTLVAAPVGLFVMIYRDYSQQARRRKARFVDRVPLPASEWFAKYFPQLQSHQAALIELLQPLGKDLEIDWTQLRPDDTFSDTFAFHGSIFNSEDALATYYLAEQDWITKHGIDLNALPQTEADTLADYLSLAHAFLLVSNPGTAVATS